MLRLPRLTAFRTLLILGALLGAFAASASPASALSRGFIGVQAWSTPKPVEFSRMSAGGVKVFRAQMNWGVVEPTRGLRNWQPYDELFNSSARAHVRVLPFILGSPKFAADRFGYPPRTSARSAYTAFVRDVVKRYGANGAFWKLNPGVPYTPVTAWQIWNEPNLRPYWPKPNAREYVSFVKLTATAIKKVDRHAKIVLAGLPDSNLGITAVRFLRDIYRVHGARSLFNVVALHPYAKDQRGVEGAVIRARDIMRRNKDSRKPVWITELGWATAGPRRDVKRGFVVSPKTQAARLKASVKAVTRKRSYVVQMVIWFAWRDRPLAQGEADWWAPHTGLFTESGSPKPVWGTLAGLLHGNPGHGSLPAPPPSPAPGPQSGTGSPPACQLVCL